MLGRKKQSTVLIRFLELRVCTMKQNANVWQEKLVAVLSDDNLQKPLMLKVFTTFLDIQR